VNEIKLATNEIDMWRNEMAFEIWNEIFAMNEMKSFMVADQDASWQLSRIHDVDGSYKSDNTMYLL